MSKMSLFLAISDSQRLISITSKFHMTILNPSILYYAYIHVISTDAREKVLCNKFQSELIAVRSLSKPDKCISSSYRGTHRNLLSRKNVHKQFLYENVHEQISYLITFYVSLLPPVFYRWVKKIKNFHVPVYSFFLAFRSCIWNLESCAYD